jgi:hypothetical protein
MCVEDLGSDRGRKTLKQPVSGILIFVCASLTTVDDSATPGTGMLCEPCLRGQFRYSRSDILAWEGSQDRGSAY